MFVLITLATCYDGHNVVGLSHELESRNANPYKLISKGIFVVSLCKSILKLKFIKILIKTSWN